MRLATDQLPDSRSVVAFGREIDCMTGNGGPDQGAVTGQDSAVIVPFRDEVKFFFGDTTRLNHRMIPNSMASTTDFDPSDGLDLMYYGRDLAQPALPKVEGEVTVWIGDAFVLGEDIYSYYISMPPDFREEGALGLGTAVMVDGEPPFERTDFFAPRGEDPLFAFGCGHASLHDGYVYQFGRSTGESWVHLKRILVDEIEDTSAYEFWTGVDWSSDAADVGVLFSNAAPPTVRWSEYHGQYLALYSVMFSPSGLLSEVAYRTSPTLTGPWSEETRVRAELSTGGYGSSYQAHWDPVFSRENGRVVYFTATKSGIYNVFIHEIQFDYASAVLSSVDVADDAYERIHENPKRSSRTRVRGKRMRLGRDGRTMVGLRLVGDSFYPATDVESAVLAIPLRRAARRDLEIEVLLEGGAPNETGFDSKVRNELRDRNKLSSGIVPISVRKGDVALRIEGPAIQDLLAAAIAHPDWRAGLQNAVLLYLTRTDSERGSVDFATVASGGAASLTICVGACE